MRPPSNLIYVDGTTPDDVRRELMHISHYVDHRVLQLSYDATLERKFYADPGRYATTLLSSTLDEIVVRAKTIATLLDDDFAKELSREEEAVPETIAMDFSARSVLRSATSMRDVNLISGDDYERFIERYNAYVSSYPLEREIRTADGKLKFKVLGVDADGEYFARYVPIRSVYVKERHMSRARSAAAIIDKYLTRYEEYAADE